jgi:hypothetical protein
MDSRNEDILTAMINGTEYEEVPQSRMEALLLELKEVLDSGGGGGGSTSTVAWKPTVDAEGNLSWTRTSSTTKPKTQNIKGEKGDAGTDGATGADGKSATIRIGTVTSGTTPSITNSGTATDAVFDFVLKKGDKGNKGDKGDAGADGKDGVDGKDGRSFTIQAMFETEQALRTAHPTGSAGDAYIVGTTEDNVVYSWSTELSDWLNIGPIKGVKGDKGDAGADGKDGVNGADGFTPAITATTTDDGVILTITNRNSTQNVEVRNGAKGDTGEEGFSPVASVQQLDDGAVITVTDKSGTTTATVKNVTNELVYGASTVRKGEIRNLTELLPNGFVSVDVIFDTPMSDDDYLVNLQVDGGYWHTSTIYVGVAYKSARGFRILIGNPGSVDTIPASSLQIKYTAFKLFSVEGIEDLENDVANLQTGKQDILTVSQTTIAVANGGIKLAKYGRIVQASFQIVADNISADFTSGVWTRYGNAGIIPTAYRPLIPVYCGKMVTEMPILMRVTTDGTLQYYWTGGTLGYEYEWTKTWISAQ